MGLQHSITTTLKQRLRNSLHLEVRGGGVPTQSFQTCVLIFLPLCCSFVVVVVVDDDDDNCKQVSMERDKL